MKELCTVEYKDKDTGEMRLCQDGTAQPAIKRVGGVYWCRACYDFLQAEARRRTGVSKLNIKQAIFRLGKEG